MTDAETDTASLQQRLEALARDRDYWRAQHDAVLADWKADADDWARERAALEPADPTQAALALVALLRFFDPATGAVTTRSGEAMLSDAFLHASKLVRPRSGGGTGGGPINGGTGSTSA